MNRPFFGFLNLCSITDSKEYNDLNDEVCNMSEDYFIMQDMRDRYFCDSINVNECVALYNNSVINAFIERGAVILFRNLFYQSIDLITEGKFIVNINVWADHNLTYISN